MQLAWDDVKIFVAVVEEGTLQAAADALGVNHSTVFRRIKTLEERVGRPLLIQTKAGSQLTETGTALLQHGRVMADHMDAFHQQLGNDEMCGRVRVAMPDLMAMTLFPPLVAEFQQNYPDITVEVVERFQPLDSLKRDVDIAIRPMLQAPDNMLGTLLRIGDWGVYASSAYIERYGLPASLEDAAAHRWIGFRAPQQMPVTKWFEQHVPDQQVAMWCSSVLSCHSAVVAGIGLALLPNTIAQIDHANLPGNRMLTKVASLPFIPQGQLWLLMYPELKPIPRINTFYEFLAERLQLLE